MSALCIPLDYEQLSEMWQLRSALNATKKADVSPKQIEQAAIFIFCRLFVTLGYLARSTNKPGHLSQEGVTQYLSTLEPLFGDDCKVIEMLETAKILERRDDGWFCQLFANENQHLAGNFKRACDKGNVNSRVSAALKKVTENVIHQAMLFPPEIFKDESGLNMTDTEVKRSMVLVQMLDRCLGLPQRAKQAFTPGVMATACNIVRRYDGDRLRDFYFRLAQNRENPVIPKISEGVLQEFDKYFAV